MAYFLIDFLASGEATTADTSSEQSHGRDREGRKHGDGSGAEKENIAAKKR